MTARANSLTDRVTKASGDGAGTWTAPAGDLRVLTDALQRLGYNLDVLLLSAGLHRADLTDPDLRIPCEAYDRLLSRAQQDRFTPNLALEVARLTPLGAYPLLDYLVLTSDTVGAGVRKLGQYLRLVGNPLVMTLHEDGVPIRIEFSGAPAPFSVEYAASLINLHLRAETDGRFAAVGVSFRHQPDDHIAFGRILGCPVRTSASWNGVSVSLPAWRLPLRRRDAVLQSVLETQANEILARPPSRVGLALEVHRALTARVAGGDTRLDTIAHQLALSGRTLQRRLRAENTSHQELLEDARRAAAERFLSGDSPLAIAEIAYLLGYSEPASFHRAFKRWHGTTPEVFRQHRRQPPRVMAALTTRNHSG